MITYLFKPNYAMSFNLLELLTKNDRINPCYTYIDGATKNNINRFRNHPIMNEIKMDIHNFAVDIATEVRKIEGVRRVREPESSPQAGFSTYITVDFVKPTDNEYLQTYKDDYSIVIRLSDHFDRVGGIEDYDIDLTYKTYDDFLQDVVNLVKQHKKLLDSNYNDWQNTHVTSDIQNYRNDQRRMRYRRARNRGQRH